MNDIQNTVQEFLQHLTSRNLEQLVSLFSEDIDWYIPGDEQNVPWLGKRNSKEDVAAFYTLLWQHTEPVSANIDCIYFNEQNVCISGSFSTKILQTDKIVDSLFFIQMTIKNGQIKKYRLLEDSYAVSRAML